jgi:CRP-like cAMP-binding protein
MGSSNNQKGTSNVLLK